MTKHFSIGLPAVAAIGLAIGFASIALPAAAEDIYIEEEILIEETYEETYEQDVVEEEIIEEEVIEENDAE